MVEAARLSIGIDPTAGTKPAGFAVVDTIGRLVEVTSCAMDDVVRLCGRYPGSHVGIDCPVSLPRALHCFDPAHDCPDIRPDQRKQCEESVRQMGIPLYWTTKRTIIARMIERCVALKAELEVAGHAVDEVYPYAAKVLLFGRPIPKKTTPEGLAWFRERLQALFGDRVPGGVTHDELDAALVAAVIWRYQVGLARAVGDPGEGTIVVPLAGQFAPEGRCSF